jgi:hypothetical protein
MQLSTLAFCLMLLWLAASVAWLLPRKRALLAKHGAQLTTQELIRLGLRDHEAWTLQRDTWFMIVLGVAGALLLVVTR